MARKRKRSAAELAKERYARARASVVAGLVRTNEYLVRNDVSNWRNAWQSAIDVRNPSRRKLYDIYRDAMADAHLSGCIQQRVGFVMSRSFKLVDQDGEASLEAAHCLDQAWFKQFCRLALDSIWYGHSLIELGDVVTDGDGHPSLASVTLIPRRHVIPEYGRVIPRLGMTWSSGIEYRKPPFCDSLVEVGQPDDLGLLLKAALHTIPKKHALSFWDCFAEIFGMPMRIARTTTRDPKEYKRIEDMIYDGASNLGMVTGMDTEIEFVESGKGDAYNVYDRRIDRANSELSKLTIGQTMTIEDGSSLSQSETHLQVFENLVEADRDMLRDVINNQLLPKLIKLGFPLKGLRFEWDDAVDYTPEQQIAFEKMVADRYQVDPSYFADKYNMPVGERLRQQPSVPGNDEDGEEDDGKGTNAHPFFD